MTSRIGFFLCLDEDFRLQDQGLPTLEKPPDCEKTVDKRRKAGAMTAPAFSLPCG